MINVVVMGKNVKMGKKYTNIILCYVNLDSTCGNLVYILGGFRISFSFQCEGRITSRLCVCKTEGEGEGGSAALSVCPQKVSTRRLQRGPQDIQGTQSIALPQPVPMSEENERKSAQRTSASDSCVTASGIYLFDLFLYFIYVFINVGCCSLVLNLSRTLGWLRNLLLRHSN